MAECRYVELGGHLCLLADKGSVVEKIDNSEEEMVDKVGSDVQSRASSAGSSLDHSLVGRERDS